MRWLRELIAIIKGKPRPSISDGAPMPGGKIMNPDGTVEREKQR